MALTSPAAGALAVTGPAQGAEHSTRLEQFGELLAAHWDHTYRFAYRLTGNAEDAEDLMQDAAEEALRAFDRFQPGSRFDRWLMRIMHHTFLDRARRRRRHPVVPLEAAPAAAVTAGGWADPEATAAARLDGPVQHALDGLPAEYRAPVVLVDMMTLSYEDAAQVLRCPIGTVRSRLHRGRLLLRERLRPYVDAMRRGEA